MKGHRGRSLDIASDKSSPKNISFQHSTLESWHSVWLGLIKLVGADQWLRKFDFLQILGYRARFSFWLASKLNLSIYSVSWLCHFFPFTFKCISLNCSQLLLLREQLWSWLYIPYVILIKFKLGKNGIKTYSSWDILSL